ncbi:olfactomedin-like [Sceloporus undulatus]|uniref:olfactomedin-like n=1 Tax=Sceloporus undulatus TaxID=8520 RepID=UPI001C4D187F|nr:olfactomedin-like [Sceloporus undulatus]
MRDDQCYHGEGQINLRVESSCDHDGLLRVSEPILVKLNWKGANFKAGSWGKDFAMGAKSPGHYWVFPANKDNYILENFRLYSSYKKLMLYLPVMEFSLRGANDKCENCGQGGGVVLFNGSFYYNCYNSRSLCKIDPHTMRLLRKELEDEDPPSFNNVFSYKGVKFQDMDMAGDEKGLWMIHGSKQANGNMVVRKVNPDTLQTGTPWTISQRKTNVSNTFMICGVLYATRRLNSTHEDIFYAFDTNSAQERKLQISLEKPLPTLQSLNYNPNDRKLYMYNDGYLVYYDVTFKGRGASRSGEAVAPGHGLDVHYGESRSLAIKPAKTAASKEELNLASQQLNSTTNEGQISAIHEEGQINLSKKSEDMDFSSPLVFNMHVNHLCVITDEQGRRVSARAGRSSTTRAQKPQRSQSLSAAAAFCEGGGGAHHQGSKAQRSKLSAAARRFCEGGEEPTPGLKSPSAPKPLGGAARVSARAGEEQHHQGSKAQRSQASRRRRRFCEGGEEQHHQGSKAPALPSLSAAAGVFAAEV